MIFSLLFLQGNVKIFFFAHLSTGVYLFLEEIQVF